MAFHPCTMVTALGSTSKIYADDIVAAHGTVADAGVPAAPEDRSRRAAMMLADAPPFGRSSMDPSGRPDELVPRSHAMIETTEVRWFAGGVLRPDVSSWFTQDGALGVVEHRCDLYWLDRRTDVGVKLRGRSTLELKIRQSSAESVFALDEAGERLRGAVEVWQKWSPADALVTLGSAPSVEVHKTIVKRRFLITGEEDVEPALADPPPGPFCDVEIVALDDGVNEAWSFAFAAQGPPRIQRLVIDTAWRAVMSSAPPADWPAALPTSCGYPEMTGRWIGDDVREAER